MLPHIHEGVAARAKEHGWHVQFYPRGTDIIEHADRLLALNNTIVLDHFASIPAEGGVDQPAFKTLLKMLDSDRVWVKISGPMRCTREEYPYRPVTALARALVAHRPDRLVFGTDWPHVNMNDRQMPNDGDLVDLIVGMGSGRGDAQANPGRQCMRAIRFSRALAHVEFRGLIC